MMRTVPNSTPQHALATCHIPHVISFLPPTTALLTLGSTCKSLRPHLALRITHLSLDPFRLTGANFQGPHSFQQATHALARLLAHDAPSLRRLKGAFENPAHITLLGISLGLLPLALSFPKLEVFETVCTDDDMCAYAAAIALGRTAAKTQGSPAPCPFLLLLAHHARRFPALSRLRLAMEWPGKNGWGLPLVMQPSVLSNLCVAALAS